LIGEVQEKEQATESYVTQLKELKEALEKQKANQSDSLVTSESAVRDAQKRVKVLEGQLSDLSEEHEKKQDIIDRLDSERERLEGLAKDTTSELEELKKESENQTNDSSVVIAELRAKMRDLDEETRIKEEAVSRLTSEKEALEEVNASLKREQGEFIERIEEQKHASGSLFEDFNKKVKILEEDIVRKTETLDLLGEKNDKLQELLQELQKDKESLVTEVDELVRENAQKSREIVNLSDSLANAQRDASIKMQEFELRVTAYEKEISIKEDALKRLEVEKDKLRSSLHHTREEEKHIATELARREQDAKKKIEDYTPAVLSILY